MKILQPTNDFPTHKFRKEEHFYKQFSVINTAKSERFAHSAVILRLYATPSRIYACLWINEGDHHLSGGGYAGGYGYHKASAAAQAAISAAGITLDASIAGVGDDAIREALLAISNHINPEGKFITHEAHA
jgi:hypothetical protein